MNFLAFCLSAGLLLWIGTAGADAKHRHRHGEGTEQTRQQRMLPMIPRKSAIGLDFYK